MVRAAAVFRLKQVEEADWTKLIILTSAHTQRVLNEVARIGRSYFAAVVTSPIAAAPALPTTSGLFRPYVWPIRPTFGTCSPVAPATNISVLSRARLESERRYPVA